MRALFHTLGCKVNQYETQAMRQYMEAAGFETGELQDGTIPDIIVINSCTVTGESDRKLRQLLHRCKREHPDAVLVLTGCMPQAFPEEAARFSEVDVVLGNAARRRLPEYIARFFAVHQRIVDIPPHDKAFEKLELADYEGRTRAFLKIEDGCNRFCSYCIIPYARGRVRSKALADLKSEAQALAERGFREIVLVGINLTAFGQDTGLCIADAVEAVCAVDGIARVRLGSIEPDHLTPAILARLAAQRKLCPQFHLALQSGCDATLKRMNRHYTTAEYAALCDDLRAAFPQCAVTTDFMVGFPGETDEEFAASLAFVEKIGFSRVHIFAYSRRAGTPAAKAPAQVTNKVKAARSRQAAQVCRVLQERCAAALIGQEVEVLLETKAENGLVFGYTPQYVGVHVRTDRPAGTLLTVRITGEENGACTAEEI